MSFLTKTITAAALAIGLASGAQAAPITDNPGHLVATGPITAVFLFADAADTSTLTANINGTIFNNKTDAIGTVKELANPGPYPSIISFVLNNLSQGTSFATGVADADGRYYARYSTNYADFGVGAMSAAALAAIAGNPVLNNGNLIFVAFEDRRNGDYDYNDLIFAFSPLQITAAVPEPASLAILGAGMLGLAFARRRKAA